MSIDPKIEAIKEKLKKLIAKEESARKIGNQAEAEAFAAKIQELIMLYEIEVDELMGQSRVFEILNEIFDCSELTKAHEADWVPYMYSACQYATFTKVRIFTKSMKVIIFGEEHHKEMLHFMAAQLIVKVRILARESFKAYTGPDKRNTYFRSFYKGAVVGIQRRLRTEQTNTVNQQQYGIVLASDKRLDDALSIYMRANRIREGRPTKMNTGSSHDAFSEGVRAGGQVGIHKGVSGNNKSTKLLN